MVRAVLGEVLLRSGDLDWARRESYAAPALADQMQPGCPRSCALHAVVDEKRQALLDVVCES